MQMLDIKAALRTTLVQKQELVRDYQSFATQIENPEVSKMFRHFAEAEGLQASQIKETLNKFSS